MIVYWFLWCSLLFNCMCNGAQILDEPEGKFVSRKYRNPDRSYKQHVVAHNPRPLPDAFTDIGTPLSNINDLLSRLRESWAAPSTYLEKRGYLSHERSDQEHTKHRAAHDSREHESDIKLFKNHLRKHNERSNALSKNPIGKGENLRKDTWQKESRAALSNQRKFFYFPHTSNKVKKESRNEVTAVTYPTTSTPAETTLATYTPKTANQGVMNRIRDSFRNIFKPSTATSLQDDVILYNDVLNEESADDFNVKERNQKYSNFRPGEFLLSQDDPNNYLLQKRSYNEETQPLLKDETAGTQSLFGRSASSALTNSSIALSPGLSVKFSDVLKNLTQADIDYVKNFLKCYKENKEKFYVDYLHMNRTLINETNNRSSSNHVAHSNFTETENKTEGALQCQIDMKDSNTTTSIDKSVFPTKIMVTSPKEYQNTTPAASKDDDTVKVDIDIKTNETGYGDKCSCPPLKWKILGDKSKIRAKFKFSVNQKVDECQSTRTKTSTPSATEKSDEVTTENSIVTTTEKPKVSAPTTITNPFSTKTQSRSRKPTVTTLTPPSTTFTYGAPKLALHDAFTSAVEKLQLNDTMSEREVSAHDPYRNKLKFLAHQHHAVDQVGKGPHKQLNLKHIQDLIDGARQTLAAGSLDIEDESQNNTKCTPIRLNEISLDLEWSPQNDNDSQNQPFDGYLTFSSSGDEVHPEDNYLREYSKDSTISKRSQVPTSYLNNLIMPSILDDYNLPKHDGDGELLDLDPNKKKREVASPEGIEYGPIQKEAKISENYSELLSSLSEFGTSKKHPLSLDEYIQDYDIGLSRNVKSTGSDDDIDYDYEDDSTDESQLFGRKKKKKRKRKHKKKYNKKISSISNQSENPSREDLSEFIPEEEDISVPEVDQIDDQQSNNDFLNFPELSDIKFHVSSDQEEDIEKFIAGLNAPPEVFSFDVEKYLKPKTASDPIKFDSPPPKTFYEFIGASQIENEHIPFITPDTAEPVLSPDAAAETLAKENLNLHPKRDILRQYIKGISEQIANNPADRSAPISTAEKESDKVETPSNDIQPDRSEALITNYANDLDVLNYGRYKPDPREASADDFIDKFYLLNDGSYSIYDSDKAHKEQEEKDRVDPVNIDIDLDLDKKFKDLNVLQPAKVDVPVEKELDLNKEPVDNLNLVYIPENVYHKSPHPDKTHDEKSFPLTRK